MLCIMTGTAWGGERCTTCHTLHYQQEGGCTSCHRGNPLSQRKNIAHHRFVRGRFAGFTLGLRSAAVVNGERLLEQLACRRCHVIGGRGNRVAVSLDVAAHQRTPEELAEALLRPVLFMPDFMLGDGGIAEIVTALLFSARDASRGKELPVVVRLAAAGTGTMTDAFTRKCGSCHRLLSPVLGGRGKGSAGPNLSGLLSVHYPKTLAGERWTGKGLARWLENPRRVRQWAMMRPVSLAGDEMQELLEMMTVPER